MTVFKVFGQVITIIWQCKQITWEMLSVLHQVCSDFYYIDCFTFHNLGLNCNSSLYNSRVEKFRYTTCRKSQYYQYCLWVLKGQKQNTCTECDHPFPAFMNMYMKFLYIIPQGFKGIEPVKNLQPECILACSSDANDRLNFVNFSYQCSRTRPLYFQRFLIIPILTNLWMVCPF